jgi:diguanylate cyclase (GGDEF)-like protein/PAS domain S-box-containing protein
MAVVTPGTQVLEQAFDGVQEAISVVDLAGRVTCWNRAAELLYGIPREDAVGHPIRDLVQYLLPDDEAALIMESNNAGQKWSGEMLVRCVDGRVRLVQVTNLPLLDDGRVVGLMGLTRERPLVSYGSREASDALVVIDAARRVSRWSPALSEELGYDLGDHDLADLAEVVHPDDLSTFAELFDDPTSVEERNVELRLRNRHDGYSAFAVGVNDLTAVPGVGGLVLTLHRRRGELSMAALAAATATRSPQGVFTVDLRGVIRRWRPGAEHLYGWTAAEITGHPMTRLRLPDEPDESDQHLATAMRGRGLVHYESRHRTKSGRSISVGVTLSVVIDEEGVPAELLVVVDDLNAARAHDEPERVANVDVLTGLPKEPLVLERLRGCLTQVRRNHGVAVLVVDVDSFKLVNDSLGHRAGDELLVAIGQRLVSTVSATDVVGRLGSDEFVVVCSNLPDEAAATGIATRILERVSKPVLVKDHEVLPAVSIGIALTERTDSDAAQLLGAADTAMYRAKANGRARYVVFDQALHQRALLRLELEEELRRALREDELQVRYQPVLSLDDGTIRGVEALVRWQHPERGLLHPSEFLPMAEETGLVLAIGQQVIAQACAQLARCRAAGHQDLTVAVNLSPRQLAEHDLLSFLRYQCAFHEVAPQSVVLELTEHALLTEALADPATTLREFRDAGFRLSLDDFGTGYCSLLYLRRFPVSQLKLDRFFIAGIGRDPVDEAIVENVLRMAKAVGLEAVAEGIERPEQLVHLQRLGCELGQGFLWAPALPGDELLELLSDRPARPTSSSSAAVAGRQPQLVAAPDPVTDRLTLVLIESSRAERTFLRGQLEQTGRIDVVGEAGNGRDGIDLVRRLQPHHVVLDLSTQNIDGLDVLSELHAVAPRALITILCGYLSPSVRRAAFARGAIACLDKGADLHRLVEKLVLGPLAESSIDLGLT